MERLLGSRVGMGPRGLSSFVGVGVGVGILELNSPLLVLLLLFLGFCFLGILFSMYDNTIHVGVGIVFVVFVFS